MQRIEPRGPKDTLCFIPSLVPIKDIIDELIQTRDLDRVTARYPVTTDEVFEAIEIYVDQSRRFNDDSILEFHTINKAYLPDAEIEIVRISELVFLDILQYSYLKHRSGEFDHHNDGNLETLFTDGLYAIIREICQDYLYQNIKVMDSSDIHNTVFESFVGAYSGDFIDDMQMIYEYLESNFEEKFEGNS